MRISSKVVGGGIVSVAAIGLTVGLAIAYFTFQTQSQQVAAQAAQLGLVVNENQAQASASWLPGESTSLSWTIANSGNTPVVLKGVLAGQWNTTALDAGKVQVSAVHIQRPSDENSTEVPLVGSSLPTSFLFSSTGTEEGLWSLDPSETIEVVVDIVLDESADNSYQAEPFVATLELIARQTTTGATWTE